MSAALTAIVLGVALIVAAGGFGSSSLLVPGIGLLGLALVALVWVRLARPTRLERAPGPARITEGEPYPLRLRAVGMRLRPPGGELRDPLLAEPLRIGPRWSGELTREVVLEGRGRRHLAAPELDVRDPLGLCEVRVTGPASSELLVLPRVEPVVAAGGGEGGASVLGGLEEGTATSRLDPRAIELEVDGLRAYRPGSPASRIHWPAVARTGELVERRLVAGGDAAPLVALDASAPAGETELDAAVRAAASLCVALARSGGVAVLLGGERRAAELDPDLHGWSQVHARLALIEPGGAPPAVARASRAGDLFWVTAARNPTLPTQLRPVAGGRRFLVAPSALAPKSAGAVAFTVAGCSGRRVGARGRQFARAA